VGKVLGTGESEEESPILLSTPFADGFHSQSGLAYELDSRQIPSNWSTGYWALGTKAPGQLPATSDLYGTEVFELNTNLLARALNLTQNLTLNDSSVAQEYRKKYDYAPANQPPKVFQGDALCVSLLSTKFFP
jgi:purine nucleoside permease